ARSDEERLSSRSVEVAATPASAAIPRPTNSIQRGAGTASSYRTGGVIRVMRCLPMAVSRWGGSSRGQVPVVPPAGLEPAPPAPEAGALSSELRGHGHESVANLNTQ